MKSWSIRYFAKRRWVRTVLPALAAIYIRVTAWTLRVERRIAPEAEPYLRGESPAIYAFWHGRLFLFPCFKPRKRRIHVLISGHSDGVLIAGTVAWFGMGTVEGSTSKRSLPALRGLLRVARAGDNIAITPDGPRGPRQEVAPGVAYLAQATGLPVIPASWSAARHKRLRSWDRFMIPWPFSRAVLMAGAPIWVADSMPQDKACKLLADVLNTLTRQADEAVGAGG